jgi:galactokinase
MLEFAKHGKALGGLDLLYSGNIPAAAGLSSSASIELVTAVAINDIFHNACTQLELVHMALRAERQFVGVQCGVMDQFIVGNGKKGSALFLNCATEAFEHVPFDPPGYSLVIADTKKQRKLSDSKYNERVGECRAGVAAIRKSMDINFLGELGPEVLGELDRLIGDAVVRKRVRHVVSENHRVLEAVKLLKADEYAGFGKLMNDSHNSLRDDYEVTGFELDAMVEASWMQQGVLGSRMTGAGFGGCAVSLVKTDLVNDFMKGVKALYTPRTGLIPDFYLPAIAGGAAQIL